KRATMARVGARSHRLLASLPPMAFGGRLERLRASMRASRCDALLVSNVVNVRYLTGFSGSTAQLVVLAGSAHLVTDGRYEVQAKEELGRAGTMAEVHAAPAVGQSDLLAELFRDVEALGLEADHVSWAGQRRFKKGWARAKLLVPTTGLVEKLRERKDEGEVARVAAAAAVADEALAAVEGILSGRVSEVEVAAALEAEMRRLGAEGPAFETIVASGPNGALPHHSPSPKRLRAGELVVVDFGAWVEGYRSDMTRTLRRPSEGRELPAELRRISDVVLASQDAGLAAVREGALCSEVDRACREVVEAAGLGPFFVHGTGHGVGLEVHEAPWLAGPSTDILSSGQVVTVEPGVYVPGLGGARSEDTVRVTEAGCEVLTLAPKQSLFDDGPRSARRQTGPAPRRRPPRRRAGPGG
ncbi:MAG TPA: Xaa-Pro peptidase family protein, partial [Acidimicrobiales bacterium]|nr:Xaa-Pro peptidase family protein [Acidimicrobiales bacterium]